MRISAVQNIKHYNTRFTGASSLNADLISYEPQNKKQPDNGLPEWFRKGVLFGLVTLAIANDPATGEIFKSETEKQEEKVKKEYFEYVSQLGISPMAYHLNRFVDVDNPSIKHNNMGGYTLTFKLSDGKIYKFDVNKHLHNDSVLYGYFEPKNRELLKYKAVFNEKNPEEFTVYIRDKEHTTYKFGRKANGELYKIEGKKKIVLNKYNAKKYQQLLQDIEDLDKFEFFTNKNDMWRKLNLILLFLLTVNEYNHDLRRKNK